VVASEAVGRYRLLTVDGSDQPPAPGQFYMLATAERWGGEEEGRPWLARPFSHATADPLTFLVDPVGPGSRRLASVAVGEELLALGPLGRGFALVEGRRALLVGGGIGVAPLAALAEALDGSCEALLGFRDEPCARAARLVAATEVALASDDGSVGRRGVVTELLAERLARSDHEDCAIYACGPEPMLAEVGRIARARGLPCQLAYEAPMACGYGACFGCAVATRAGFVRLCLEGPVLDAYELGDTGGDG